jgi:molybdopterin-containing oxidoreductase family iron-sulfur binding subunit
MADARREAPRSEATPSEAAARREAPRSEAKPSEATGLDRRDFLKVVGLSAGAVATAACKEPVETIIPYLVQPEEIVLGVPTYYASTCRECPEACAITVKTREGRPIKLEGNPDDPRTRGALCARGQAGLRRTYDPTRFKGPMVREGDRLVPTTWQQGIALLVEKLRPAGETGKVVFVGGHETGTLDRLIDRFMAAIGSPNRIRFEPFAYEALRQANRIVFGTDAVPRFDLAAADVVVAFGTDFLETWLAPLENQVGFAAARSNGRGYAAYVGPRLGVSGASADEWIAPEPGSEILIALALGHELARRRSDVPGVVVRLLEGYAPSAVAASTGVPAERITRLAERLARAEAPLALPPGNEVLGSNGTAFAAAVQLLNWLAGAVGRTVAFGPDRNLAGLGRFNDMRELAGRMRGGEISVLLVHGANPVYAMPEAFGIADALAKVPFVVSFSSAADETTSRAHLVLPDHTPFESWGDAEPAVGVRRLQQPTIRAIHDTRALGDVLLDVGRQVAGADRMPPGTFQELVAGSWAGPGLAASLARGGDLRDAPARPVALDPGVASLRFEPAALSGEGLVLLAYPSLHFYDGRSARFPRMQDLPDAVTKTTWASVAELHPDTAGSLGVTTGDVLRVSSEAGSVELPAFVHAAVRPGAVAIAIGQGHQPTEPDLDVNQRWDQEDWLGRTRTQGVNVLRILPGRLDAASGGLAWLGARAKVEKTGERYRLANVQPTFDQSGRGFARSIALADLAHEASAHAADGHGGDPEAPALPVQPYHPKDDALAESPWRWGMTVDLDACTGCNACVVACAEENNTPVIGEEIIRRGREMNWIRIERYVEARDGEIEVRHLPMMCQHCGAAPCETVCPVYATYHTADGLNAMIPNRCIGTRYCSNNCPYKVRRFNYLPYDFEVREPDNLGLNPDVTVRTKGVMEKCTFCVQRIVKAKRDAKAEARDVRDGEVVTACQQTCPSRAIHFGNLRDPESGVSKLWDDRRRYVALENLNTRPGVGYLRSIRRSGHEA